MRTYAIALAMMASTALAFPTWNIPSADTATEMQIEWTGSLVSGEPEITIKGSLEYVLNEIRSRNPDYDFSASSTPARSTNEKRETGKPNCSPLDRIDFRRCDGLISGLRLIGGSKCPAPAKQSTLISMNSCEFYLFNNATRLTLVQMDGEFSPYCNDIANDMEIIDKECRKMPGAGALWFENHVTAFRGQPRV
ncbi:hypothetical protein OQA88_7028 [Cercophora sp. LCS_1]